MKKYLLYIINTSVKVYRSIINTEVQINRLNRLFWFLTAIIIRPFVRVKKNRIFCWTYSNKKFSDSPRAITEYILNNNPEDYCIYWGFDKNVDTSSLDDRIHVVRKYNFTYILALYSSRFVFNNCRNNIFDSLFIKKQSQKYIQTWHGSFALKQIEKDAIEKLSKKYIRQAKFDSKMCDLMLSNSKSYSDLIKNAFWYNGQILERCVPRNDIFYNEQSIKKVYTNIRKRMRFAENCKIVLYAPTFRTDMSLKYYAINWNNVIPALQKMFGDDIKILVRLHPNMASIKGVERLIDFNNVYNITTAPDITEFLLASDVMISDYTSAMFDFILLNRPCFIYTIDKDDYDRGFYWNLNQLPFPIGESEEELINNIKNYNSSEYLKNIFSFKKEQWAIEEDGNACKRLLLWMTSQNL